MNASLFSALTESRAVGHVGDTQVPQGLTGNPVQSGSGPAAVNHETSFPRASLVAATASREDREEGDEPEDLLAFVFGT